MENDFGFVSCIHAASAFINPEVKPLSSEDLDTAIGFECDEFQVDDLLEFSNEIIGGQITATHLSDQSSDSAVNATGCQHLSEKHGELLHKAKEPEEEANDHCLEDEFSGLESLTNLGCCTNEQLKVDYNQELLINLDTMMVLEIGGAVTSDQFQMTSPVSVLESSATSGTVNSLSCWENQPSFPGRARSKRSRLGSKMWSLPVMTSSSSSQESGTSYTDSLSSLCLGANQKPPKPRQRMRLLREGLGTRKCAHCLSEKTPQWRAGPGGPKTLCNACGVRFKSGRLFPEYRPALSPTFESHIHSNSHRKVLDMRRHKEMEWIQQQQLMNLCHLQP